MLGILIKIKRGFVDKDKGEAAACCSKQSGLLLLTGNGETKTGGMEYDPSTKAAKKARTRYRFKAKNNEEVDAEQRQPVKFADVAAAARSAVTHLWSCLPGEASTFEVAKAFWPSAESQSDMCKALTENILRNVAALKWRILSRLAQPPLSCAELEKYMENGALRTSPGEQEDEEMASALSRHCEKLLSSKPCCLDWNWARQVRDEVQACARADREKCFSKHAASFLRSFRGSSLQEETTHALQRKIAGGDAGHARRFHSQASNFVVQRLARAFHKRGGRQLATAPAAVKAAAKVARVKKVIHKRPKQFGSPAFFYVAQQQRQGDQRTNKELLLAWKNLDDQSKAVWKSRQVLQATMRRRVDRDRQQAESNVAALQTTWHVGDQDFPLRQEFIDNLLNPFRLRDSGLAKLAEMDDADCKEYADRVRSGHKYHSMDAARLFCQASLAAQLTDEIADGTSMPILSVRCEGAPCPMKHPGLCVTRDAQKMDDVFALVKALPAESCLVRCEATIPRKAKFFVFARAILGQGGVGRLLTGT